MRLYHKDHKGPGSMAMRRVNGQGMNVQLSNNVAEILEPIANEMPRKYKMECGSTESALNHADYYNLRLDKVKAERLCYDVLEELLEKTWPKLEEEASTDSLGGVETKQKFQGDVGSEVVSAFDAVGLYPSIT